MNPEISVQLCLASKNIMNIVLVFFGPKNITFHNILTQKYRTYLPVVYVLSAPPGLKRRIDMETGLFALKVPESGTLISYRCKENKLHSRHLIYQQMLKNLRDLAVYSFENIFNFSFDTCSFFHHLVFLCIL